MKGVAIALVVIVFFEGLALANPPLKEPEQYEQFCNNLLVAGNGTIDMSTSMQDKRIAMDYFNSLSGQGLVEMDLERAYSQVAKKLVRNISLGNGTKPVKANLFESSKITYSGLLPLVSEKYIRSKEFYGGIGAMVAEEFSVTQLEQDQKTSYGSTETATGAHLIGVDTKGSFNGSWQTDSSMHKIFYKDIKSHQSFSGNFEIDRQVTLQEKAETSTASLEVEKTQSIAGGMPGDVIAYNYQVKNTGYSAISNIALVDSDLGPIKLSSATLNPGQIAYGRQNYTLTEEDILSGSRESTATAIGLDGLGKTVKASGNASIAASVEYYPGGSLNDSDRDGMNYLVFQKPLNLTKANATIYAIGVNMTRSRQPRPECPFSGWPKSMALSQLLFGITDGQSAIWQTLSLLSGNYSGSQIYGSADGNITSTPPIKWNSTYGGKSPNGGFSCTDDPGFDTFDLKLDLFALGFDKGIIIDSYQRIYNSTEAGERAGQWRQVGHQDISANDVDLTVIHPFILVGNMNTTAEGTISWSNIVVTNSTKSAE
jgi:hypothetical protein